MRSSVSSFTSMSDARSTSSSWLTSPMKQSSSSGREWNSAMARPASISELRRVTVAQSSWFWAVCSRRSSWFLNHNRRLSRAL